MINLILKNKFKILFLSTFVLVLGIGFHASRANVNCLSTTGWIDSGAPKTGMPCPLIHNGYNNQKKIGPSDTDFSGLATSSLYIRENSSAGKIISIGNIALYSLLGQNSKSLCANDVGEISICTTTDTVIDPGNLHDTLRFDGVKWVPTSSVQNSEQAVSFGLDNWTMQNGVVASINGNIQIKGTNYKNVGNTENRIMRNAGSGLGKWEKYDGQDQFKMIRFTKEMYPTTVGATTDTGSIWGAAIKCPDDYPIAVSGGGDCPGGKSNVANINTPIHFNTTLYDKCLVTFSVNIPSSANVRACTQPDYSNYLIKRSDAATGSFDSSIVDFPNPGSISNSNGWMYTCSATSTKVKINSNSKLDLRPTVYALCARGTK